MKHRLTLFMMLFLAGLAAAMPSAAQDVTATPAPCTKAEMQQTTDLASSFGDKISTPMVMSDHPTADGLTTTLLDLNDTYQSFANVYPNFPMCADGMVIRDAGAMLLNQEMVVTAITLFNTEHSADKTLDADITPALSSLWTIENDQATAMAQGVGGLVTQLKAGTGMASWIPACSADQLKFTAQLDDLEKTYNDQLPALQVYLDSGTVDKSAYIAIAGVNTAIGTALKSGSVACADVYGRAISDVYLFGDTFIALTLGQIAPYMANNPNAEKFTQATESFNAVLGSFVNVTTPTETP